MPYSPELEDQVIPSVERSETDKALLEIEAMTSGVLVEIVRQVDDEVPVGEVIAYIETGE